jgi:hypothetical protein
MEAANVAGPFHYLQLKFYAHGNIEVFSQVLASLREPSGRHVLLQQF